jgi:uroporphyrinogen decarboxylase
MLTHKERIKACINDDPALDRPPVALWRHFPVDDQDPIRLAESTIMFQQLYDLDIVKITPSSSFCLKDWDVEDEWEGNTEGTRKYTDRKIQGYSDWEKLQVLESSAPYLADQIKCIRYIRQKIGYDIPLIQTIFSPLAQAKNLAGPDSLAFHLKSDPKVVAKGLATIAETTARFISAAIEAGIDGIFYAIQHAQADLLTLSDYLQFGLPFDLISLSPAQALWCNILHLHGRNIHFDLITRPYLPSNIFHIVNWHDRETQPTLGDAKKVFPGVVCGGINQTSIALGDPSLLGQEAEDAIHQTNGRRFVLGTGCVTPIITPHGNILTVRRSVEKQ